jgi:hypothetical protein
MVMAVTGALRMGRVDRLCLTGERENLGLVLQAQLCCSIQSGAATTVDNHRQMVDNCRNNADDHLGSAVPRVVWGEVLHSD